MIDLIIVIKIKLTVVERDGRVVKQEVEVFRVSGAGWDRQGTVHQFGSMVKEVLHVRMKEILYNI